MAETARGSERANSAAAQKLRGKHFSIASRASRSHTAGRIFAMASLSSGGPFATAVAPKNIPLFACEIFHKL
jgi:hypothetical protein